MKRDPWVGFKIDGTPDTSIMVAETPEDVDSLAQRLADASVTNGLGFFDGDQSWRLDVPDAPDVTSTGALALSVTAANGESKSAFFWVVEIAENAPRYYAWWAFADSPKSSRPWPP